MIDFDLSKYIAKRDEFVANIYDVDLKVANLWVIKICPNTEANLANV